jgi:hypothetical protein
MNHLCENLESYLDGSLDIEQRADFDLHVESCNSCSAQIEADASLDNLLMEAWSQIERPRRNSTSTPAIESVESARNSHLRNVEPVSPNKIALIILAASLAGIVLGSLSSLGLSLSNNSKTEIVESNQPDTGQGLQDSANRKLKARIQSNLDESHRPGVVVSVGAANSSTILVTPTDQNSNFTIVNVYPVFKPANSVSYLNKEQNNDQEF